MYKFIIAVIILFPYLSQANTWEKIRSDSDPATNTWQYIVCEHGAGWRKCELPVTITLSANPNVITGFYAGSIESKSVITATVLDYFGKPVSDDVTLDWSVNKGSLSQASTKTNPSGVSSVVFTAPGAVGSAIITIMAREDGGSASTSITLNDKWGPTSPNQSPWVNSGGYYGCTAWSPSTSTVTAGQSFTQTRSCLIDQTSTT